MTRRRVPFRVSKFVLAQLATTTIHGDLAREAGRVGSVGPAVLNLDSDGLADLAELLDAVADRSAKAGNTAGARTCYEHAERARQAAYGLTTRGRLDDWRNL